MIMLSVFLPLRLIWLCFLSILQAKDVGDLNSWKSIVSMQLETLLKDNSVLRFLSYFNNISLTYVML